MIKPLLFPSVLALCAILSAGCNSTRPERKSKQREGGFRPPPQQTDVPSREPSSDGPSNSSRRHESRDEPPPSNNPPPQQEPVVKTGNLDYAKPVAGKPGFVTSPFAPASGYIDVRGFPPGTEVKDPYTGKTFLVP